MSTQEVVERHLAAFGAGDVDASVADYADDAVLVNARGVIAGIPALREAFAGFYAGLFAPGTYDFGLDSMTVEGEVCLITWHARCATADVPFGSDVFIVRDGRIVAQTVAMKVEPR